MQNAVNGVFPEVTISSPEAAQGFSNDFPIVGTAYCPDFFKYTVMYSTESAPTEYDWRDVITHNPQPTPYYSEVLADTLTYFNTSGQVDSTYYIRLATYDVNGNRYVDIVKIYLDKTPPEFIPGSIGDCRRYDFDENNYYILAVANEPVQFCAKCFSPEIDTITIINSRYSTYTALKLPEYLPEDELSYFVKIKNKAGLTTCSEIYEDELKIENSTVPTNGFKKYLDFPQPGYLCGAKDINNNDKQDLVFMEFPEQGTYGTVNFCEKEEGNLVSQYHLPTKFQPWSLGDTNADGKSELVGNIGDSLIAFEALSPETYPMLNFYKSNDIDPLYGCALYDLNGDGRDELLVNTFLDSQRTAYMIYLRVENQFEYSQSWLLNNTSTYSRNELTPRPQFGYLDGDDKVDILLSDIDGDILIFEVKSLPSSGN